MLAHVQGGDRHRGVPGDGGNDVDGVDLGSFQQVFKPGEPPLYLEQVADLVQVLPVPLADGVALRIRMSLVLRGLSTEMMPPQAEIPVPIKLDNRWRLEYR